jgi:hypothetical protein
MKLFEMASRRKIRFSTTRGSLTTEDLWTLSKPSLDKLMRRVKREEREMLEGILPPTDKQVIEVDLKKLIIDYVYKSLDKAKEVPSTPPKTKNLFL